MSFFGLKIRVVAAALLVVPALAWPSESATPAVVFPPRPPEAELQPQNENEEEASVIVLDYRLEISSRVPLLDVSTNARRTTRYRGRYLVKDHGGVEALKQHTFFGDETDLIIAEVQGQTISPDGSVHPIDPDKDVQILDIEVGSRRKGLLRTVNFPRVEPGAILDLVWAATAKDSGGPEPISLATAYPIRRMEVHSQGRTAGADASADSIMMGVMTMGAAWLVDEYHWVPFMVSQAPEETEVRLSSRMDLELRAANLPARAEEPMAPPSSRTVPRLRFSSEQFPERRWRDYAYLFDPDEAVLEQEASTEQEAATGNKKAKIQWLSASLDATAPLAQVDALGLQVVPLSERTTQGMWLIPRVTLVLAQNSRNFARRTKKGETPEDLERVAPAHLPFDERVDRIFRYAREQIQLQPEIRNWFRLDKLKKKGAGNGESMRNYVKYLLDQAGIENRLVMLHNRRGLPFLALLERWAFYGMSMFLEVQGPGGELRYLEPDDPVADAWSFSDRFLGGIAFRDPEQPRADWEIGRVPLTASIKERTVVRFHADANEVAAAEFSLGVEAEMHGSAANAMRHRLGWVREDTDVAELEERRQDALHSWLRRWLGDAVDDDFSMEVPDPEEDIWSPYSFSVEIPWSADVQDLGGQFTLPVFPESSLFHNPFVAERRQHPLWLVGGEFEVAMTWTLPPNMKPLELKRSEAEGPGGLCYRLEQSWDEERAQLTSKFEMRQPYILPASDYEEVRELFAEVQRETGAPVLIGNSR